MPYEHPAIAGYVNTSDGYYQMNNDIYVFYRWDNDYTSTVAHELGHVVGAKLEQGSEDFYSQYAKLYGKNANNSTWGNDPEENFADDFGRLTYKKFKTLTKWKRGSGQNVQQLINTLLPKSDNLPTKFAVYDKSLNLVKVSFDGIKYYTTSRELTVKALATSGYVLYVMQGNNLIAQPDLTTDSTVSLPNTGSYEIILAREATNMSVFRITIVVL